MTSAELPVWSPSFDVTDFMIRESSLANQSQKSAQVVLGEVEKLREAVRLFDFTFGTLPLVESCNRKSSGWCEVMLNGYDVLHLNREKSAFGNEKGISWNITSNKKIGADSASIDIKVRTLPTRQMFKALGRNLEAEFLADFPYDALKVSFISFPVASKKSHFPGMDYAGDIVPLLQQETTESVDNYCPRDLAVPKYIHVQLSS